MRLPSSLLRKAITALSVVMALALLAPQALAKPTPIYGADFRNSTNGVSINHDNYFGAPYNTFNRFADNIHLCVLLGHGVDKKCNDVAYMDEREFVSVSKVFTLNADGTYTMQGNNIYNHNYTASDLKEGDVIRTFVFVHNDASTVNNSARYTARDVRVSTTLSGNRILGKITAKNAFAEAPSQTILDGYKNGVVPVVETVFEDDAAINLPSGLKLEFLQTEATTTGGYVARYSSCTAWLQCSREIIGNPIKLDGRFSLSGNTLTYAAGDMVGSQQNAIFLAVDLVVLKGERQTDDDDDGNRDKPGTYQICVDGTPNVRFVWDNAQVGDTLTVYRTASGSSTEEAFTYTVGSRYGTVQNTSVKNASGQFVRLQPGDKIRWRVGSGSRFSQWYEDTVIKCSGLDDGLRIDYSLMAKCVINSYDAYFAWNTPGTNKRLDVSTDANFSFYWSKDVSNIRATSGPAGFSYFEPRTDKPLLFKGNTTYYWRVREGGKIYSGPSFSLKNCDYECEVIGGGNSDTCIDGKIVEHDDAECRAGVCACIEVEAVPGSAGDFNVASFIVNVSNRATASQTIARKIEVRHLRPDGKKGYFIQGEIDKQSNTVIYDDTCVNGRTADGKNTCDPREQGSFDITRVELGRINKGSNRPANAEEITVDFSAFQADRTKPIIVNNLYPGDSVDLKVNGIARTTKEGKAFATLTNMVDYYFFMKSKSNNGVGTLTIARPFLLTSNDGSQLTAAVIKGLSDFRKVYSNVFGEFGPAISGTVRESNSQQVNRATLGFGSNLSGMVIVQDQNKTGGTATLNSEADFMSKLHIRPDKTRIFSTRNQNVELGTLSLDKVDITERSTIYVEFAGQRGTVNINADIVYKGGTPQVPAFALVVKNGDIVIHPRVKQMDGVYVALETSKFVGDSIWKSYYGAGNEPLVLLVNGALYGNIDELIPSRPNVRSYGSSSSRDQLIQGSGIAINFDGRIYSFPAPGLREIIGGVYELLREPR